MEAAKGVRRMEGYDADELLLMLDDDLFLCGDDAGESER